MDGPDLVIVDAATPDGRRQARISVSYDNDFECIELEIGGFGAPNPLMDSVRDTSDFVRLEDMRRLNGDLLRQFELTDEVLLRWHLSGYLLKKGRRLFNQYQRRYLVLDKRGFLAYFKTHSEARN